MRQLIVELRGARQAVFSCHEATSLTTKPLELADPTGWLLAWSLGGYMVARRNRTMTQYHFCQSDREEMRDEGNCSNGSGCGNGRDEAGGAARAAGGGAQSEPQSRQKHYRRTTCTIKKFLPRKSRRIGFLSPVRET